MNLEENQVRIRSRTITHFLKELENKRIEVQKYKHDHGALETSINEGKSSNGDQNDLTFEITIISLNAQ